MVRTSWIATTLLCFGIANATEMGVPFKTLNELGAFLKANCVACHGPAKAKGNFTVHNLDPRIEAGRDIERWEKVLKMVEDGEMPPEEEKQPSQADKGAMVAWIQKGLSTYAQQPAPHGSVPTARRMTNFEYQNTIRDLLGIEVSLIKHLPEDPEKPYHFNNVAEMMLIGPEQMDRYLETARRAMASAIVDPEKPKIHQTKKQWKFEPKPGEFSAAELGMGGSGPRRGGVHEGMSLASWPATGEFRVRVKASAVLPPGVESVPLRLLMGYGGLMTENQSSFQAEQVGKVVELKNSPDRAVEYEFRGRVENFPVRPARAAKNKMTSESLTITPQNLYDDGTLNDAQGNAPARLNGPRVVVESMEFEAPLAEVWPPEHHTRILFESPLRQSDVTGYAKEVIRRFMPRAYRRPATPAELEKIYKIYELLAPSFGTFEGAIRETLAMVLVSPQFLYHTDSMTGGVGDQYELASKLSYFLWGSMPDNELFTIAGQGKLNGPVVIERQVRRLLADGRSADFVRNFTNQWLSISKMKTVTINRTLFPRFLFTVKAGERTGTEEPYRPTIRDYMMQETAGFIGELIRRNASLLQVVDSDFAYLNQPLAAHYRVSGVQGLELRPVSVKPEQNLGGLLTQGSVLVGNSTGSAPHPIYRAVWLREAILGEEVRPPPAEVPALVDSAGEAAATAVTIKDLLKKHRQEQSCNACHATLDPWGIPFEQYNAVGQFQPQVPKAGVRVRGFQEKMDTDLKGYATYLAGINTVPVDAESRVPKGPVVKGLGGADGLKAYLLKSRSSSIVENMARRLLSYAIGRRLTFRDDATVTALVSKSKQQGNRLQDMIVTICQSETFRGASTPVR